MQIADRVRQILLSRGLTLYQVSQRSAETFGQLSPYFIPQGLYHDLAIDTLSPNIHQLIAFSNISNYRLCDWLTVFGFRLDDIPKLQLLNQGRRTVLLDSSVYDELRWTSWFDERHPNAHVPDIAPLGQILKSGANRRAGELLALAKARFLYAKVGSDDLFAFPSLAAGSIVRIDVRHTRDELAALGTTTSKRMFLVENDSSLNCGHLMRIDGGRVLLCSQDFPFTQIELNPGSGVKILGVVNAEIRPLTPQALPRRLQTFTALPNILSSSTEESRTALQQLLRLSRMRVGISFREASAMSQRIARDFEDPMYFAAAGTLSDYEKATSPLRHVQKIISLCALYCIDFWNFLRVGGLRIQMLGAEAMSDEMASREIPPVQLAGEVTRTKENSEPKEGFLSTLIGQWEELPLFIRDALPGISNLKAVSLSDIFWVGGNRGPIHPALIHATFVAVNRRIKTPQRPKAMTAWEQPLYMILRRDGGYICASCELRRGILTVHPHSERPNSSIQFRNGVDAEVVGQVTTVVRTLS